MAAGGKLVIGVTGGIGSGKSTAAEMFRERGAGLVDTDALAHELTRPAQPAVQEIGARLGREFVSQDGTLDRAALRARVFSDPAARRELESILHPLIRREAEARVASSTAPYVLLLVPLLIESGAYRDVIERILVMDCDESLQLQRAMQRSHLDEAQVRAIMQAQVSRSARLAAADDVLVNDGTTEDLERAVALLDARYRALR